MRIILLGPPGAGKGTQGKLLAAKFGVPHVSIGDCIRGFVRTESSLAREIRSSWERGQKWQPLSDELSVRVAQVALHGLSGFILDGFPRNVVQAELAGFLDPVNLVIVLSVPEEVSIKRILGRMREGDSEIKVRQRLVVEGVRLAPLIERCRTTYRLIEVDGTQSIEETYHQIRRRIE